jgi:hypothetical protein
VVSWKRGWGETRDVWNTYKRLEYIKLNSDYCFSLHLDRRCGEYVIESPRRQVSIFPNCQRCHLVQVLRRIHALPRHGKHVSVAVSMVSDPARAFNMDRIIWTYHGDLTFTPEITHESSIESLPSFTQLCSGTKIYVTHEQQENNVESIDGVFQKVNFIASAVDLKYITIMSMPFPSTRTHPSATRLASGSPPLPLPLVP